MESQFRAAPVPPAAFAADAGGFGRLGCARTALAPLIDAEAYIEDLACPRWLFAVELDALRGAGLPANALRWLVAHGLVEHAYEVRPAPVGGRRFVSPPAGRELVFRPRSCFLATPEGIAWMRRLLEGDGGQAISPRQGQPSSPGGRPRALPATPVWNAAHRQLRAGGLLVKEFKLPATNQERILSVLEEEGWPAAIDDPLPRMPGQDPKRRLRETIAALNRRQRHRLLHFEGNGTGQRVLWRYLG